MNFFRRQTQTIPELQGLSPAERARLYSKGYRIALNRWQFLLPTIGALAAFAFITTWLESAVQSRIIYWILVVAVMWVVTFVIEELMIANARAFWRQANKRKE